MLRAQPSTTVLQLEPDAITSNDVDFANRQAAKVMVKKAAKKSKAKKDHHQDDDGPGRDAPASKRRRFRGKQATAEKPAEATAAGKPAEEGLPSVAGKPAEEALPSQPDSVRADAVPSDPESALDGPSQDPGKSTKPAFKKPASNSKRKKHQPTDYGVAKSAFMKQPLI